ncbi:MAG: hydrogenase formation protein HypD [Abditibacteriota bacterium]|nr:hydrogenase formation protein HypD [Abditibacteriota bacterium]
MNIYKDFKNPDIIEKLVRKIRTYKGKTIRIMEVCGSHTDAIGKYGIREILPKNVTFISGPGCPVCVTDTLYMDKAIELSYNPNIIICSFGDLIKVKGSQNTLKGAKVVLSPMECLDMAKSNPQKEIVFLSVGFETTTPITALTLKKAYDENIKNISFFVSNKTMPNILRFLLSQKVEADAFLFPGHVATIEGYEFYERFCNENNLKGTVCGFEPVDILASISFILFEKDNFKNLYGRFVSKKGNEVAQALVCDIFEECDTYLREIGLVKGAGLKIRDKYSDYDANTKFNLKYDPKFVIKDKTCLCGEIMLGRKSPLDCPLFGNSCTPMKAFGPCMVSAEGSCASYYKYKSQ